MNRREFLHHSVGMAAGTVVGVAWTGSEADPAEPARPRAAPPPAAGPLRVHPDNRRYFTDGSGKAVYLTGSHMWNNLVDMGPTDPPPQFDFEAYLRFLARHGHNFIRLWTWELVTWDSRANGQWAKPSAHTVAPQAWARTGPGTAPDGKPKFDLGRFDPAYFDRLRSRVGAAGKQGVYVSVMLFEGWSMQRIPGAWRDHPFHPANNVQGIDGDTNGDGKGLEVHTLANPAVTARQEAYVRKVIDTVNDLDNVLYEISNENHPASTRWQYHMIDFIHRYERGKPRQHPVGMTFQFRGGSNRTLFDGPADWISPNPEGGYRDNPPAADGRKVILSDTDHLWGIGGNRAWVWKSFMRGLNPILMDPYDGKVLAERSDARWDPIRRAMGQTRRVASRVGLAAMTPQLDLASTHYCLANPPSEYLVYLPDGGTVSVDLSEAKGELDVAWFDPRRDAWIPAGTTRGGARRQFSAPFEGDGLLHVVAPSE